MGRIGVISAMSVEIEGFAKQLGAKEAANSGFYRLFEGELGGNEIYLACSGIGKVNAGCCTQRLIDRFGVEAIINMGVAGGISKKLRTLDIVVGSEVFYHDYSPAAMLEKYYPFTSRFGCDKKLVALAEEVCAAAPETASFVSGPIASGDCFVESQETKNQILNLGGMCCEMEGAAIGHAAHVNGVPFVIIRSISDLADEGAGISYDEFVQKAAIQANRVVLGILHRLAQ